MASHTQDDGFHEIQLNGKQLVFLFMAATVVSVVIFLCGVLVGRGVRAERGDRRRIRRFERAVPPPILRASTPARADRARTGSDRGAACATARSRRSPVIRMRPRQSGCLRKPAVKPPPPRRTLLRSPTTAVAWTSRAAAAQRAGGCRRPRPMLPAASRVRRADRGAQRAQRSRRHRAAAVRKGYAAYVQPPASGTPSVFRVRVGKFKTGARRRASPPKLQERRAVQALGYALNPPAHPLFAGVVSGVLLALSFPKFGHPAFAWIALAPLLVALVRRVAAARVRARPDDRRRLLHRHAVLDHRVMAVYGGLQPWVAVLVNAAAGRLPGALPGALRGGRCAASLTARAARAAWPRRCVWVATELGRTYLFTGFPWVLLGYSQATVLPVAQLASLFGVYGVSVLVAAVSAALAIVRGRPSARPLPVASPLGARASCCLVVAVVGVGQRCGVARRR